MVPDDPDVPQLTVEGVRNAAGFGSGPIAPGMIVSLFGKNLGDATAFASSLPLPDSLGGTRVWFNLDAAPLFYAAGGQLNAQVLPDLSASDCQIVITRSGVPGLPITVPLSSYSPGIFTQDDGEPVIVNYATGRLVGPREPARPGDILIVYANGLGPVSVPVKAGTAAPVNPLSTATAPVTGRLANARVTPMYAGLAPGFVGVFQVNIQIPSDVPTGTAALIFEVAGASSNSVAVAIQRPLMPNNQLP